MFNVFLQRAMIPFEEFFISLFVLTHYCEQFYDYGDYRLDITIFVDIAVVQIPPLIVFLMLIAHYIIPGSVSMTLTMYR